MGFWFIPVVNLLNMGGGEPVVTTPEPPRRPTWQGGPAVYFTTPSVPTGWAAGAGP